MLGLSLLLGLLLFIDALPISLLSGTDDNGIALHAFNLSFGDDASLTGGVSFAFRVDIASHFAHFLDADDGHVRG